MTMWFSVSEHFRVILYSALIGILTGSVYDVIKLSRALFGFSECSAISRKLSEVKFPYIRNSATHHKCKSNFVGYAVIFIGDIIFSLICAAIYSLFLFHSIRGQLRWYFIVTSAVGFLLYYFTVSKFNMLVTEIVLFIIRVIVLYIIKILLLPFCLLRFVTLRIISVINIKVMLPLLCYIKYNRRLKCTKRVMNGIVNEIKFDNISL